MRLDPSRKCAHPLLEPPCFKDPEWQSGTREALSRVGVLEIPSLATPQAVSAPPEPQIRSQAGSCTRVQIGARLRRYTRVQIESKSEPDSDDNCFCSPYSLFSFLVFNLTFFLILILLLFLYQHSEINFRLI
jgi:hypothetical protein